MVIIYHSNRPVGGITYGFVHIYEDGKLVESFHAYDKSGEADDLETAIASFERTSEILHRLGYDGTPISIVSKYSDYGYAILCGDEWPEEVGANE